MAQRHNMLSAGADRLHAFKSAAAMIGAMPLQECAEQLESSWRNGIGGDVASLATLIQLTERSLAELKPIASEAAQT